MFQQSPGGNELIRPGSKGQAGLTANQAIWGQGALVEPPRAPATSAISDGGRTVCPS